MENNRYTPRLIAGEKIRFAIPVYQRLFAWRRQEIRKLLFDLKEHFAKNEKSPYYIGMMTVIPNNRGGYDLIDGQQRFTVMMLIATVLRKYDNGWESFLKNDNVCRLKFTARSADNDYMNSLVNSQNTPCGYVNKKMADAIKCIKEFCTAPEECSDETQRAKCEFQSAEQVKSFAEDVCNYLTFFLAELPNEYMRNPASLNKYFEVMNSAGKGLEQHEILMVELLRECRPENREEFTKIWKRVAQMDRPVFKSDNLDMKAYAKMFEKTIQQYRDGNYSVKSDGTNCSSGFIGQTIDAIKAKSLEQSKVSQYESHEDGLVTFPELLLLVLDLTLDEEERHNDFSAPQFYQTDKLLGNFEKFKVHDVEQFYQKLLYVRTILDYYIVRRDFFDGQGNYKLIYQADNTENEENRDRLRQYQSMLYVSTDFYRWLKPFVKYLMDEAPNDAQTMLNKLKAIDRTLHKMPTSTEDWKYGNIDRYWFWRLDYCLWDKRKEIFEKNADIVEHYVFRRNRSIEHLHPQDESHNEEWNKNDIDSFGNLAMISQSFNSTQSHDHIQVKFARIKEQIDRKALQSIKLLKMCMDAQFDHTKWTSKLADNHKEEMINILKTDIEQQQ